MSTGKVGSRRAPKKVESGRVPEKGSGEYREGWIRASTGKGRI